MRVVKEQKQKNITFYLSDDRVIVCTRLQCFKLEPKNQYTIRPHKELIDRIYAKKIKSFNQLITEVSPHTAMNTYCRRWI